jgi:hypothetical protein
MWGNMIIKSISGKKIYQSEQRTVRAALEEGVEKGIDFSFANLRQAKPFRASLDGIVATGATFWGADLEGADMGLADLRKTDMRCANLKDTCLAESDLSSSDVRGAYFSGTIVEGAVLDRIRVSCPSVWELDLAGASSIRNAVFTHKGEEDVGLDPSRWVLQGPESKIVVNGNDCFWRGRLHRHGDLPAALRKNLHKLKENIECLLGRDDSHNATIPIPKRVNSAKQI